MNRLIVSMLIWVAAAGMAHAVPVIVTAGGTALDGGPAFEMRLGDAVVGTGQVSDPVPEGGQQFKFEVDEALFASNPPLSMALTNDVYKKDVGDRNLAIISIQIGDTKLLPADFVLDSADAPGEPFNGWLYSSIPAHANAPVWGWIAAIEVAQPPGGEATATAAAPAKTSDAAPTPTAEVKTAPSAAAAKPADAAPAPAAETKTPAAAATAPVPAEKQPASAPAAAVAPAPAKAVAECGVGATVEGFANNAVTLTVEQRNTLDQVAPALADCSVVVTGYSSLSGSASINQFVSKARAQAVADYFGASKTPPAAIEVVGSGATDSFGEAAAANRRVVVERAK